jgi:glyoxylase-like metal-dependent hydrolase (beta-lactamase superfamily II)
MDIFNVSAVPGAEAYLLITGGKTALVDSGYAFCAGKMIDNIKEKLNGRPLDYILLTHSHYDHASGSVYCRSAWPEVKIVASEYTRYVFSRPSAIKTIRDMNDNAAAIWGAEGYEDKLDLLSVDIAVHEGDVVDLGGARLRVIEAPGHTKCSIAFYCEEEKLMIGCETFGTITSGTMIVPCYMVGYDITLESLQKAMQYCPERILTPHFGIMSGEKAANFFMDALHWARLTKDRIIAGYKQGKSEEDIIEDMKSWFYTDEYSKMQPERAFRLNAVNTIAMIIRECGNE